MRAHEVFHELLVFFRCSMGLPVNGKDEINGIVALSRNSTGRARESQKPSLNPHFRVLVWRSLQELAELLKNKVIAAAFASSFFLEGSQHHLAEGKDSFVRHWRRECKFFATNRGNPPGDKVLEVYFEALLGGDNTIKLWGKER